MIFRNLVMSRLDQGPITGEMRLGFLVQDICICIFTSWSSPTRRAGLDDSPQPCQCIASKRLHSVCPMPMCRKETPPRVPPSFSFIFIYFIYFFSSCQILSQIHFLRGRSVAPCRCRAILESYPDKGQKNTAWSDYPQHTLKRW